MNIAIVDIGSNAIKYKIFDKKLNLIEYYRHPLRLGRDVFSKGSLSKNTINDLEELLERYLNIFKQKGIEDYHFIATSALRDCTNKDELLLNLSYKGINVKFISGDIEASLLAELNKELINTAVIDIGGGSVEICINSNKELFSKSFQLGAVRLLNFSKNEKVNALQELTEWLRDFKDINHLYGLGGNLRALMQANDLEGVLDASDFSGYVDNYLSIDDEELIQNFKIPKDRVDIIPEALNLYQIIIDTLNARKIENSFWSISDGLVKKIITDQL